MPINLALGDRMSYIETFIQIAPDSDATEGIVPVSKRQPMPIHIIQYELLTAQPYHYTHEELVFAVYVRRQGFTPEELATRRAELWAELFQKGHPCLRASALTKKYGWGAHYNAEGKIALYGVETDDYQRLVKTCPTVLNALRSKR